MKKTKIFALAAAFSVLLCATPVLVYGDEMIYDPENDPLVSLSYINEVVIPGYEEMIDDLQDEVRDLTSALYRMEQTLSKANEKISKLEGKLSEAPEETADALSGYQVVYMRKGSKLIAESPLEVILRSGTAIVVSITANGVNNITDGTELLNAAEVPLYNCLLVPRGGDGRGIQITSEEAYVMVRGDYKIVE